MISNFWHKDWIDEIEGFFFFVCFFGEGFDCRRNRLEDKNLV